MTTVQDDLHRAFQWVRQVFDESRAFISDTETAFSERGFRGTSPQFAYATTLRAAKTSQEDYPFVYLVTEFFYRPEDEEAQQGTAAFVAISFFDTKRVGPTLFAGTVTWNDAAAKLDHWLVNATARAPGWRGAFRQAPDGTITEHLSLGPAANYHRGIERLRNVEFPLTRIDGPEALAKLVDALTNALNGNEDDLRAIG